MYIATILEYLLNLSQENHTLPLPEEKLSQLIE